MILSFAHKGLERFFETGDTRGVQAKHAAKLRIILTALEAAVDVKDMNMPSLRLHPLKGTRSGIWSVSVSGAWRITFRFKGGNAEIVNYEQYH